MEYRDELREIRMKNARHEDLVSKIGSLIFAWIIGVACGYALAWKALEGVG